MKKLALVSAAVALLSLGAVACTSTAFEGTSATSDISRNSSREDANRARAERAASDQGGDTNSGEGAGHGMGGGNPR